MRNLREILGKYLELNENRIISLEFAYSDGIVCRYACGRIVGMDDRMVAVPHTRLAEIVGPEIRSRTVLFLPEEGYVFNINMWVERNYDKIPTTYRNIDVFPDDIYAHEVAHSWLKTRECEQDISYTGSFEELFALAFDLAFLFQLTEEEKFEYGLDIIIKALRVEEAIFR